MHLALHNVYPATSEHRTFCPYVKQDERFVYLAANEDHTIVKVGASLCPENRLNKPILYLGVHVFRPMESGRWRFRLVRAWSLGRVSHRDALTAEHAVHVVMRTLAPNYRTEYYEVATAIAARAIDAFFRGSHLQHAVAMSARTL